MTSPIYLALVPLAALDMGTTGILLVIAGVLDTQVPIADEYLLLNNGDTPKDAWINPMGGHLGRQVGVWPDPLIFKQVIIPWLVKILAVRGS